MAMTARVRRQAVSGRSDAGFGLVGVLVALILLSVGVLSVSNVLTQSVAMQAISAQRTGALQIAQSTMETIRAMDPSTVTAQPQIDVNEAGWPNGDFTREVAVGEAGPNLIEVTVTVTAPRSNPIRLVTWIYRGA